MNKGLIIAAPASGTGKTTLTIGLLRALLRNGTIVQPLKSGPDYIDPVFHKAAAGRVSYNIDGWSMDDEMLYTHIHYGADADLTVVEGAMGLFDGGAPSDYGRIGATAELASMTGWPVILIMNVSGQAQSAAAIAKGFAQFHSGVHIAGVVLNQVASSRHEHLISKAIAETGIAVLGSLPRQKELTLPSRHLGLVQANETKGLEEKIDVLADFVETHLDISQIAALGTKAKLLTQPKRIVPPPAMRVAIAQDAAFSFMYPHLWKGWYDQGVTLLPFSPLADEGPDKSAEAVWLPGGYPELYSGALSAAQNFRKEMQNFAQSRPIHGECGGYMTLGRALIDKDGQQHEMLGLLNLVTSFAQRKFNLGYRRAEFHTPLYNALSCKLHGHEFHYSSIIEHNEMPLAQVYSASGELLAASGSRNGFITGSYFHLIGEVL